MSAVTDVAQSAGVLDQDLARRLAHDGALRDTGTRRDVGLELEFHLVDLADPGRRPSWPVVAALLTDVTALVLPGGSSVTAEPGGQLELSTPPAVDVVDAVTALRADRAVLRAALADRGFGSAPLGADPARPPRRINPAARYVAMAEHFAAMDCPESGREMMASTAALQLNLDAGPRDGWADRMRRLHDLGPTLLALSACSPMLGGGPDGWRCGSGTGWRSARQHAWQGIDNRRTSQFVTGDDADPASRWADYALAAPVLGVDGPTGVTPVTEVVTFADWLAGRGPADRAPTAADLELHLTTLFPPVRPRGYLEVRYLDAQPDRWWPALAAIVAVLADVPAAADAAADATAPVADRWTEAARFGLADPALQEAATACARVALEHCPSALHAEVSAYAELVESGRTPGDLLAERIAAVGPVTALEEAARD